jgi:hypothetical protein
MLPDVNVPAAPRSRRRAASLVLATLLVALVIPGATAAAGTPTGAHPVAFPGTMVETRAETRSGVSLRPLYAPAAAASATVLGAPTADIQVSYTGFTAASQEAFQAAVDVWETLIVSSHTIHVDASWTSLPPGVLGSAGPSGFYLGADNFVYPVALYEARCNCETAAASEIHAQFNSDFTSWYLGTDGNTPSNKWDFFSVVMHELGHGLGVMSSFDVDNGLGYWGFGSGANIYALRYDTFEWSASTGGTRLTTYGEGSVALKNELTDGSVFFGGPEVVSAAGSRIKLYAPNPWSPGSSNSHLDEATFGPGNAEALMTPALSNGETIHSLGPVTMALLRDVGWETSDGTPTPTPPDNDNFTAAKGVTLKVTSNADTDGATVEVNEPAPSCMTGAGKTVWYKFKPTINRKVVATTAGSDFDTVLAVYTGPALTALTQVRCNNNYGLTQTSRTKLPVVAGTTYWFQVGAADAGGSLVFKIRKP